MENKAGNSKREWKKWGDFFHNKNHIAVDKNLWPQCDREQLGAIVPFTVVRVENTAFALTSRYGHSPSRKQPSFPHHPTAKPSRL